MAKPKRPAEELDALKALVAVYGTREAARIAGIPHGTISSYAVRYKWKRIHFQRAPATKKVDNTTGKDAADLLIEALEKHKNDSTLNLARYVDRAAKDAAKHGKPLEVARKVRDVAGVHQILFPQEEETGLIEGAILIGTQKVTQDTGEILAKAKEIEDIRARLPDR